MRRKNKVSLPQTRKHRISVDVITVAKRLLLTAFIAGPVRWRSHRY